MARELRLPLGSAEFNRLRLLPSKLQLDVPWWNLRWAHFDNPKDRFFATASGRLTPSSGTIPCLYLAEKPETSFHQLYGDTLDACKKQSLEPLFTKKELEDRIYLKTATPLSVNIYDLTAKESARTIGLDLATLYTREISFPREFAQRLHDHPSNFDGILYLSRHTQTRCLVLWATHTPALKTIALDRGPGLWALAFFERTLLTGSMRLFGTTIRVAAAPA
jgi:hypothetical protein